MDGGTVEWVVKKQKRYDMKNIQSGNSTWHIRNSEGIEGEGGKNERERESVGEMDRDLDRVFSLQNK